MKMYILPVFYEINSVLTCFVIFVFFVDHASHRHTRQTGNFGVSILSFHINATLREVAAPPIADAQSWVGGRVFPADRPLLDVSQAADCKVSI
jgi:hypothetical protein